MRHFIKTPHLMQWNLTVHEKDIEHSIHSSLRNGFDIKSRFENHV